MALTLSGSNGVAGVDGSAGTPALQGSDSNTGIAFGADTIIGSTGGSERFRCDSSGRWLLGTSSARSNIYMGGASDTPKFQFEASGNDYSGQISLIQYTSAGTAPTYTIGISKSNTPGTNTIVASGDTLGTINFVGNDGTNFRTAAQIQAYVDATPGSGDMPGRIVLSTTADGASSPTERMRIRQNGNIGIGVTGYDVVRLAVNGQSTTSSDYALAIYNSSSQDLFNVRNDGQIQTGTRTLSPYNNTTSVAANMVVGSDGSLNRSTSSKRYKTDIETLEDSYADAILNVRPVWYRSLCAGDNQDWGYWGFIAEEVAQVDPRLVFWKTHERVRDEEGKDTSVELEEPLAEGVQYDRFVPHLLNLIKRQQAKIESLETRLAALEVTP